MLAPPPPAYQVTSVGPGPRTVVPPTPMANGLDAGELSPGRPGGPPLTPMITGQNEPVSPLEVNSVWPWAAPCWRIVSSASVNPVTNASASHSPAEKLAWRVELSLTQRLIVMATSSLA